MYDISNQIFVLLYQRFWSFVLLVQEDGRASVGTAGAACCSIKDRTQYKKWGRPSIRRWSGPWREIQCGVSAASEGGIMRRLNMHHVREKKDVHWIQKTNTNTNT